MTDSFWTKVLWSRFIKHFRKLTDEQIIKDIHESMDALEDNDASGDSFGAKMVAWANERRNEKAAIASRENGNLGGRPKKNQDTTADRDTREDSLNMTHGRNAVALESGTSANLYGDAATRESADESTTVSKNMRRVPQNEAPAHGFSGGRAAQGTMSRSPEAAAQSGKAYDQVAYHSISTDEKPAGVRSLPSPSRSPVGNRHAAVDVLNLAYAGEFGNVRLTQEQYAQLGIKFGNQQKLNRAIDSLSCQIENGEKNPQNHYAELVKWASYRDDMEEKEELRASSAQHYETVSEHNARIVRESDKWIDEYYAQKRKAANGK